MPRHWLRTIFGQRAVTCRKIFERNGHQFWQFQVGYDEDATCYEYATANRGDWDMTHTGGSISKIRVCGPTVAPGPELRPPFNREARRRKELNATPDRR